jgi:lysophospholipase L1-like esterase
VIRAGRDRGQCAEETVVARRRGLRRAMPNLALVVASCVVGLGICEVVARHFLSVPQVGPVFTTYVPDLGLWNKSNLKCTRIAPEYRTQVTTNAAGLRGAGTPVSSANGHRRILCIGDSFTFGKGVDDSSTYAVQLERILNAHASLPKWDVLNAGVVSFGTANEYHFLRTRGRALQPDVVVLQVCPNDFQDNVDCGLYSLDDTTGRLVANPHPYEHLRKAVRLYESIPGHAILDNSYAFNFVRLRLNLALLWPVKGAVATATVGRTEQPGARLAAALFDAAGRWCQERRTPLVVVVFDLNEDAVQLVTRSVKPQGGVVLDLHDLERRYPSFYYPVDRHWNASGHRYVAERLAACLKDSVLR